jgi:hypothetical protein
MALDPTLSLQIRRPEILNPVQQMSLRNIAQQIEAGGMEITGAKAQAQAQTTLSRLAQEPDAFDDQGLPTPQFIRRVSATPGLAQVGQEMAQRRLVTMRSLLAIASDQAALENAAAERQTREQSLLDDLKAKSLPAGELAAQEGASPEQQETAYEDAWKANIEEMYNSGSLTAMVGPERAEHLRNAAPMKYSLAKGAGMKLEDIAKIGEQRRAAEARLEEQRAGRLQREEEAAIRREERADIREEKKEAQQVEQLQRVESVEDDLDRLESAAKELLKHPGLSGITGLAGTLYIVPGTDRADADAALKALKARVFVNTLQSMREASKTGGAVGNVTEGEGKKLETTLGSLERVQSYEQMQKSLRDIVDFAQKSRSRIRNSYENRWRGEEGAPKLPPEKPRSEVYPPMPGRLSDFEPGQIYQTPRGPARYSGRVDAQGNPVFNTIETAPAGQPELPRPKTIEEAKKLPPGTRFIDPNGVERVR